MLEKRWAFLENRYPDVVRQLKQELNLPEPLAFLLSQRQITSYSEAKTFFRPSLSMLHNPMLMKDMEKAVERIAIALGNGERIMVYGDYDVDGTTAVAMFYHFLNSFYSNCIYYIPDRHSEGYGVSQQGIDKAIEEGVSLIITLDCGIKSTDLVSQARQKGIDFIICDHHLPSSELPEAYAVLDPKRSDCDYPYKELSGCGVGFKLIQALVQNYPQLAADPFDYLDLLVISIAADIVPITGENRVLSYFGLQRLKDAPRPGLKALMELSGMTEVSVSNILFRIAPRINAAGRISHGKSAVALLLTEDESEISTLGTHLQSDNESRRNTDEIITREALEMIESDSTMLSARSTVLFKQDWHKGVIGIVASRCIEKYYRPTIILTRKSGDLVTGSARSVNGFDVYSALSSCSSLLEQFGGHMYAAGMTLKENNVRAFQAEFERVVASSILDEHLIPEIQIDTGLNFDDITPKFYRILKQMAPFGPMNMNPVFCSEQVIAKKVTVLKDKHLKLTVAQHHGHQHFDAIGFGMSELIGLVDQNKPFRLAYSLEENHFRGKMSLQLMIKDIKGE
jgi:single-stranded-DNA-specific exonuclease